MFSTRSKLHMTGQRTDIFAINEARECSRKLRRTQPDIPIGRIDCEGQRRFIDRQCPRAGADQGVRGDRIEGGQILSPRVHAG